MEFTRRYFQFFLLFDYLYKYNLDDVFLSRSSYGEVFLNSSLPLSEMCAMDALELGRFMRVFGFDTFLFRLGVPKRRKRFKSFSFCSRSRSIFAFFDVLRDGAARDIKRNGLNFSLKLSRDGFMVFHFKELGELDSLGSMVHDYLGWSVPFTFSFSFVFPDLFSASLLSSLGFFVKNYGLFFSKV